MPFLPYLMGALQFFALMFMFIGWGLGFFMARRPGLTLLYFRFGAHSRSGPLLGYQATDAET